jgi:thiazole synthase
LIVGTGGFRSLDEMERALEAAGTEIVTVGHARVDPLAKGSIIEALDRLGVESCRTRRRATRLATPIRTSAARPRGARTDWIKLEVIGDDRTLFPTPSSSYAPRRS